MFLAEPWLTDLAKSLQIEVEDMEFTGQSLNVKLLNGAVDDLIAKVWLDGVGPTYFYWAVPQTVVRPDYIGLGRPSEKFSFVKEEEHTMPVWIGVRGADKIRLLLNTTRGLQDIPIDMTEGYIDLEIQFVGIGYADKKRRKYRLNTASWNDLNLTEQ
jgi:hypothetical protein